MDYLSVQQHKAYLDDAIYRAIVKFEKDSGKSISEVTVHRLDEKCTSISTRTIGVHND